MQGFLGIAVIVIVIAMIVSWWKWIVGVLLVAGIAYAAYAALGGWWQLRQEARAAEVERVHQLISDANAQHHSYLRGLDHGLYGNYKPADLDRL